MSVALAHDQAFSRDSLGCLSTALNTDQETTGSGLRIYRKRMTGEGVRTVETPPSDRGYLLGLSMRDGHQRRIHHGRHSSTHSFDRDSIYIRNFSERYRAELNGSFDFLLVEVPLAALDGLTNEAGQRRIDGLKMVTGHSDPILAGLLHAMRPVLERPAESSKLFLDQMGLAIGTFVAERYGAMRVSSAKMSRRLSVAQERRAKDLLHSRLDGSLSIAQVAEGCQLSRSYFTQAFRQTTGQTPHQWVLSQRVQQARELLTSSKLQLAQIAAVCGFADQSHFSRVFARATGTPPAQWRRQSLTVASMREPRN